MLKAAGSLLLYVLVFLQYALARTLRGHTITSSLAPHRIGFPEHLYKSPSGVFNPAAVYSPDHGWVYVWRLDECFYRTCGVLNTRTKAGPRVHGPADAGFRGQARLTCAVSPRRPS